MSNYEELKRAIRALVGYPHPDWYVSQLSADSAISHLEFCESKGMPAPKFLIEDDGVTLKWKGGDWNIYLHFPSDSTESEYYCLWNKNG
jgi:hypothetical protein